MKHTDILFGWIATAATFVASHFNAALGATIGLLTLGVMILRFRREWKHRDDEPDNEL